LEKPISRVLQKVPVIIRANRIIFQGTKYTDLTTLKIGFSN